MADTAMKSPAALSVRSAPRQTMLAPTCDALSPPSPRRDVCVLRRHFVPVPAVRSHRRGLPVAGVDRALGTFDRKGIRIFSRPLSTALPASHR
jgi:hypothetical protein